MIMYPCSQIVNESATVTNLRPFSNYIPTVSLLATYQAGEGNKTCMEVGTEKAGM